jgi:hypothetical protein
MKLAEGASSVEICVEPYDLVPCLAEHRCCNGTDIAPMTCQ